jgi:hypothetical protein
MGFGAEELRGYLSQLKSLQGLLQPLNNDSKVGPIRHAINQFVLHVGGVSVALRRGQHMTARSARPTRISKVETKYPIREKFSLKHQVACIYKDMLSVGCLVGFEKIFDAHVSLTVAVGRCVGGEAVRAIDEVASADKKCVELLAHVIDALLKGADYINDRLKDARQFVCGFKAAIKVFSIAVMRMGLDEPRSITEVVAEVSQRQTVGTPKLPAKREMFEARLRGLGKQRQAERQYTQSLARSKQTVYRANSPVVSREVLGLPGLVPEEWGIGY